MKSGFAPHVFLETKLAEEKVTVYKIFIVQRMFTLGVWGKSVRLGPRTMSPLLIGPSNPSGHVQ